ncbi:putative heterokaryon incompatibility protein [Rosellinia necatrix]|uniref:Putative heterokaryon incompatibility protein n=1 Tax=Rosellinia necatrix TaxID=77044 RepID=A0A1W2TUD4_ROSNE|nr:putative heterokaryon incompatibility protein [Rosellinia necatrix]
MDLGTQLSPTRICDVCIKVPWLKLQAEDVRGTPHHKTRKALEESAKSCILCEMVLRAAISNYRDSRGTRHGRGYWRQSHAVDYHDQGSVRDVMYTKEMGSCMPESSTDYRTGAGRPVISPTGVFDADFKHIQKADDEPPSLETLEIGGPGDDLSDLPVWLYGNWWADSEPKGQGDDSHLWFMGVGARFARSQSHFDVFNLDPGSISLRGSAIGVCTTEESPISKGIPGRLREMNSNSDTAFSRLESWIKECSSNHPCCGTPPLNPKLPSRVVDIFAYDRGVTLFESKGQRGRYIALSHCWGASSRLMTTRETIEDLKEGIAISLLPNTFQDAIEITKRLGIRYLWVDCLCIIQDDAPDWERESSRMAEIYRNAYLTISASASTDSYSGCFPERKNDSYVSPPTLSLGYDIPREATGSRSCTLSFNHTAQPGVQSRIQLFEEWLPGSSFHTPQRTHIGTFGRRFDPIATEPLSSRGWTLQERLLSPRVIHYATDQMYFECEFQLVSEDGFKFLDIPFSMKQLLATERIPFGEHGISRSSGVSFTVGEYATGPVPGRRWKGGWLSIIENYSKKNLTVDQDKLPAIAGVARVIAEETGDTYIAGLWGRHFMEDLYWRVYAREESFENNGKDHGRRPIKGKVVGTVSRPRKYRAPSWSWASIDAPVKFNALSYSNLVAHLEDYHIEPAGSDEFGRVSDGRVELCGPIYEIKSHNSPEPWDRHGIPVAIEFADHRGVCTGEVYLDMPGEPLQFPCYALFLDPANALIIKGKDTEPYRDDAGNEDQQRLVPKNILTTEDINRSDQEMPKGDTTIWLKGDKTSEDPVVRASQPVVISEETHRKLREYWKVKGQSLYHKPAHAAVRIGVGRFVKRHGHSAAKEPRPYNAELDGPLGDNVLRVGGDESWGPVTRNDPIVSVTIF